jgi:integrase
MKSIGRHGSPWTPDTARNRARELLGTLASGTDPFAQSLNSESFGAEIERYLLRKHASLKPRSFEEVERYMRKHCAPLHRLKLDEIDRRTIAVLLGQIEQVSGPIARNRARSALSDLFSWCITEGLLETNPVQGTAKVDEGGSRERVLSHEELRKLWRNLGEDKFSDIVRLLLLTGQRRGEISALAWSEVDLAKGMIILPPTRTKNKRQHELPLSRQALTIIERQPRRNSSEFLFSDVKGYKDWDTAKTKLDKRIRIAPWRLHDLRRTCATGMAELGVQPHIIEAVLNHMSGHKAGVAGIYNRARYEGEMRNALQQWADHVEALIVGPRKQPVPTGLMERAFAVARGGKIVPEEDLANLARQLTPLKRA